MSQDEKLEFFVSKKVSILVVALRGFLSQSTLSEFEKCKQEIASDPSVKFIAIDVSQLENITVDAVPSFALFQKFMRDHKIEFRVSGLKEDLKDKLHKMGVIRHPELSKSLKDSLALGVRASVQATKSEEVGKKAA